MVTDGARAYVSELALGNVTVIDLATGAVTQRVATRPFPTGLALGAGGTLLVTHLFNGEVTAIDTGTMTTIATVSTGADTNLSQFITVGPAGENAYLPQTRSYASNPARLFDTTVFPVVNVLDLDSLTLLPRARVTLDTADQPVSMPFAVALAGGALYVANAGSDDVSVVNLATGRGLANVEVGANPRGIAALPDGSRVFVNNVLDGTLSVIGAESNTVTATVRITDIPLDPVVLLGKRIFNAADAPVLTTDNWISCAVCHFDGTMNARTWADFPDGPRNTPSLLGVGETLPVHWSGDLDELEDVEATIRVIQAGTELAPGEALDTLGPPHQGLSPELDALAAFMRSLAVPPSPYQTDDATFARGQAVFSAQGCATCHTPPLYTDRVLHDVGTGDPAVERNSHGRGTSFDTPSLRGLWLTAPYLHDGTAAALEDVFSAGSDHDIFRRVSAAELDDLVDFLFALPRG